MKWSYKMLFSSDPLRISLLTNHHFNHLDMQKNISTQFFDLDIENQVGRGNLAKFDPPMDVAKILYRILKLFQLARRAKKIPRRFASRHVRTDVLNVILYAIFLRIFAKSSLLS